MSNPRDSYPLPPNPPVQSVLWSHGGVTDGYQLRFFMASSRPLNPLNPVLSDPGGQLYCDVATGPAPQQAPPLLVPGAQSWLVVGTGTAPAPRPRLKAGRLILNLLALAFSSGVGVSGGYKTNLFP